AHAGGTRPQVPNHQPVPTELILQAQPAYGEDLAEEERRRQGGPAETRPPAVLPLAGKGPGAGGLARPPVADGPEEVGPATRDSEHAQAERQECHTPAQRRPRQ